MRSLWEDQAKKRAGGDLTEEAEEAYIGNWFSCLNLVHQWLSVYAPCLPLPCIIFANEHVFRIGRLGPGKKERKMSSCSAKCGVSSHSRFEQSRPILSLYSGWGPTIPQRPVITDHSNRQGGTDRGKMGPLVIACPEVISIRKRRRERERRMVAPEV